MTSAHHVSILDSHTAGEPTRLVLAGGPDLGRGPLADRRERFRRSHDDFRTAVVNEPRGSDVIVGALLCEPFDTRCTAGVIFFNNVGYLGMCGHGTIGVVASLAHLGRIAPGVHRMETPVGIVTTTLLPSGAVTVENVPSFRLASSVPIDVPGNGKLRGDVAWGGNWFYLVEDHGRQLSLANVDALTEFTWAVRQALAAQSITGTNGAEIDHIEIFGPPQSADADSSNFVLCPGKAYDRSPCGTGTSAKLACLYADGKLAPGQVWRQAGILGTVFEGSIHLENETIIPSITGTAYVTAESTLLLDPNDPFCMGIPK
ncbi:MAG: proline racemase family protein [Silvibacterium sp.]|nr:proline racemase family protein [Silvibacterium sp.]